MSHEEDSAVSIWPPLLLLLSALAGFLISNSHWVDSYIKLLDTKIAFYINDFELINKSFLLLVNDGLMAVFFLFIGLELKREIVVGELSDIRKASLPIFAAIGGMIFPAIIYFLFNQSGDAKSGWGIPMATDIAFALGVLTVLGSKVPKSLKILLAAIAIVDDLGAILVIAFFYTSQIGVGYFFAAIAIYLLCLILNRMGVMKVSLYVALGLPMWYFMLKSGIHATIAGVMLASTIPLAGKEESTAALIDNIFNNERSPLDSPAVFLEKSLLKWVSFLVIPIFAFANSGVQLTDVRIGAVSMGVIFGLVLGKPLGITVVTLAAKSFGWVEIPKNISLFHLVGLGSLAGIGFTMSLFIGSLAFKDPVNFNEAKLAILLASAISATLGSFILLYQSKKNS